MQEDANGCESKIILSVPSTSSSPRRSVRSVQEPAGLSRRETRRLATQDALIEAAMRLLSEKGYEETTTDEIAAAAGISRRTLFRHFPTKADIVTAWTQAMTDVLTVRVNSCPAEMSPWQVLESALEAVVPQMAPTRAEALAFVRLIEQEPGLRSVSLQKYSRWEESLATALAERLPDTEDRMLAARAAARAGVAAFRTALDEWIRVKGRMALVPIIRRVFALQLALFRE